MHVSVIFIGQDVLKSMQVVSLEKLTNGASGLTRPGAKKGSKNTGLRRIFHIHFSSMSKKYACGILHVSSDPRYSEGGAGCRK